MSKKTEERDVQMVLHMLGYEQYKVFEKYGEKHFIYSRNYYGCAGHDSDLDDWVKHDLMSYTERDGKYGLAVTYHLKDKGIRYLEEILGIFIHDQDDPHPEDDYALDNFDKDRIIGIWELLQENDLCTSRVPEYFDVAITMGPDDLDIFMEMLDFDESIPAMLHSNAVVVKFSDLLDCKASMDQIWAFRPSNMREEY